MNESGVCPDQTQRLTSLGSNDVCLSLEHRSGGEHARQPRDITEHGFTEATRAACRELKARLPHQSAGELSDGAVEAVVGYLRGEQQRDTDSDPEDREEFLDEPRTEPDSIQVEDAERFDPQPTVPSHTGLGGIAPTPLGSSSRPSRSVCTRSA